MRSAAWARLRMRSRAPAPSAASRFGTNSGVSEILIEKGRAVGVVTDKGEKLAARAVVSNLHPKLHLRAASRSGRPARRLPRPHRLLSQRLGLFPHELGFERTAKLLRASRARRGRASRRAESLSHPASPIWNALSSTRGSTAGRLSRRRNANSLDARRFARAPGPACRVASSASMSRRNCPTGAHGTKRARRSPTS